MRQYTKQLTKSAVAFRKHIAPILKKKCGVEKIVSCEGGQSPAQRDADYQQCIDYQLFKGGRRIGLANRILFRAEYKDKITLRKARSNGKPTEYQKLKSAVENNGTYPEFFCISCVVDDEVKSCIIFRTSDLLKFIDETDPPVRTNYDSDKQQRQDFYCFDWAELLRQGYKVWILTDCA